MDFIESLSQKVRHSEYLEGADWFWDKLRPSYDRFVAGVSRNGLHHIMNGTDEIVLHPSLRGFPEEYEPEIWKKLISQARCGDVIADVGAFIGLYTIALAKGVGPAGRVFAFEPDQSNFVLLKENIRLNSLGDGVAVFQEAVGDATGEVHFMPGKMSESHVAKNSESGACTVNAVTLDNVFAGEKVDLLKVDVEGYEEKVIRGSANLLGDPERAPRAIFIEVHPYAWPEVGTTSGSLLELLRRLNYYVMHLNGEQIGIIEQYGEIVAVKSGSKVNGFSIQKQESSECSG